MQTTLPPLYSAQEFADRYPAEGIDVQHWCTWLRKWRQEHYLRYGAHYLMLRRCGDRPAHCYVEKPVLRLVLTDAAGKMFGQQIIMEHGTTIRRIVGRSE